MQAAIVTGPGRAPVFGEFAEPVAGEGECVVNVIASGISHVTRGRAAGSHYSAAKGGFPFVPGVDGAGRLADGRRTYFVLPRSPWGSMAERAVVPAIQCVDLPERIDAVTAAAIANPGMSSWAALSERARLVRGETVLVNGATGVAGRLAVQVAKHMGAGKVIATGRNPDALAALYGIGADVVVPLAGDGDANETRFREHFAEGVDVVIDYLWGESARSLLIAAAKAGPEGVPVRYVEVGSASGSDITLPSAVLRSSAITLMGSGLGSVAPRRFMECLAAFLLAAAVEGWTTSFHAAPLSAVEEAWQRDDRASRTVLVM